MGLIVITVQDTENGAVVSLASEPQMDMSAAPVGEAQMLAHTMLAALPMNAPRESPPPGCQNGTCDHDSDCAVHNGADAGPCDCKPQAG